MIDGNTWNLLIICASIIAMLWLVLDYHHCAQRDHKHSWVRLGTPSHIQDSGTRADGGAYKVDCWRQHWSCACGSQTFTDSGTA